MTAQLICPIAYYDPSEIWNLIQDYILKKIPLRQILIERINEPNSRIIVDHLPLKFLPSTAALFKDTDHPFRWFLAPFCSLYFIQAETLEAYKEIRIQIRKWIETFTTGKRYDS